MTVQYSTLQHITAHYSSSQYITVHYSTLQYITVHYSTLQYKTVHNITLQGRWTLAEKMLEVPSSRPLRMKKSESWRQTGNLGSWEESSLALVECRFQESRPDSRTAARGKYNRTRKMKSFNDSIQDDLLDVLVKPCNSSVAKTDNSLETLGDVGRHEALVASQAEVAEFKQFYENIQDYMMRVYVRRCPRCQVT